MWVKVRFTRIKRYFLLGLVIGFLLSYVYIQNFEQSYACKGNILKTVSWNVPFGDTKNDSDADDYGSLILVGVMTARKYLDNRARAINMTWAHGIPGKVVFFVGEGPPYKGDLSVVQLTGVSEDSYPPQKKSFAMLEYMSNRWGKHFKWFVRADDDVSIKGKELGLFLNGINDSRFHYIGQPGYGRVEEKDRLGLVEAFCMGGPGVILSSSLLRFIGPKLSSCLSDTMTSHEDTELGRCIAKTTRVSCTVAYEMRQLMYQNYRELNMANSSFKRQLGSSEINALSLHPVKDMSYAVRLEIFLKLHKLKKLTEKYHNVQFEMKLMDAMIEHGPSKTPFLQSLNKVSNRLSKSSFKRSIIKNYNLDKLTSLPKGKGHLHPDDYWEAIKVTTIHSPRLVSARMIFPVRHRGRQTLMEEIKRIIKDYIQATGGVKTRKSFQNFQYQKMSTTYGNRAIVFVDHQEPKTRRKYTQPIIYNAPLSKAIQFRESTQEEDLYLSETKKIVMVMTAYQRSSVYHEFLSSYAKASNEYKGDLELRVTIFKDTEGDHVKLTHMTAKFREENPKLPVEIIYSDGEFNRGKGLMKAIDGVSNGSLILLMDTDMTFSSRFLQRVSANTVRGKTTFFPIYFALFDPEIICYKKDDCRLMTNNRDEEMGFWRSFSYGIGSIYKSDLLRSGGFRTNITGWGLEDVELFEKALTANLATMRVIDPGIYHKYHPRKCDKSLPENQLESCITSGAKMRGSVKGLGRVLLDMEREQGDT